MSAQPPLNHQSPCSSSFLLVVEGLSVTTPCPPLAPLMVIACQERVHRQEEGDMDSVRRLNLKQSLSGQGGQELAQKNQAAL